MHRSVALLMLFAASTATAADVTFNVEVPYCTPSDRPVYLRSNRAEAATFVHDEMTKVGATTYQVTVDVVVDVADFRYKYANGICDVDDCQGIEKAIAFQGSAAEADDRLLQAGQADTDDYIAVWRNSVVLFDADGTNLGARSVPDEMAAFCAPYLTVSDEGGELSLSLDTLEAKALTLEVDGPNISPLNISSPEGHRHRFDLGALPASEPLTYRVLDGDTELHTGNARAAPAAGGPVKFASFGDTQYVFRENIETFRALRERILAFDPDVLVSAGDMVHSEKVNDVWVIPETGRWNAFFAVAAPLLAKVPLAAAMGNHEEDHPYFWSLAFPEPDAPAEDHYWYVYGNTQFIALYTGATEGYYTEGMLESQTGFLEDALSSGEDNPNIRWRVVYLHRGVYSEGTRHGDGEQFFNGGNGDRPSWYDLLETYGVDVVIAGHNHNFTVAEANGTRFVTMCSGAPEHPINDTWRPATLYAEQTCAVGLWESTENTLRFNAERPDGTLISEGSFALCRESADCEELGSSCPAFTDWSCTNGACAHACVDEAPDGGVAEDAGAPQDGGADDDAGMSPVDAGADAGEPVDAGEPPDAGEPVEDAGADDADAGADDDDAGHTVTLTGPDGGTEEPAPGCLCDASTPHETALGALALLGLLARRRRRR